MPVEVIDLISSPQAPPPSPPNTTSTAAVTAAVNAASAAASHQPWDWPKPKPAARALDHDIFDLTDQNDSPSLPSPLPAPPRARPAPKGPGPKASRTEGLSFLSDDFDSTVDLFDDVLDARQSKKLCVGPGYGGTGNNKVGGESSRTYRGGASGLPGGGPAVMQPAAPRKWNMTIDPIQTSSSDPFASSPHQAERKMETFIDLSRDDDPFASSPRIEKDKGKEKEKENRPPERPGVRLPSSPLLISSQGNGLDSPLPNRASKARGKVPLGWDHISSSAPEAIPLDEWELDNRPSTSRVGLKRSHTDGADFDLADLADMPLSSDEDDFPDICGIRPSKSSAGYGGKASRTTGRGTTLKKSAGEKGLDKSDKAAAREAEKRRKQMEKEDAKEERAREKMRAAALAEVNKVRTDKKVSTPEMIVDLPSSLNPSLILQVETLLEDLKVKWHQYSSPVKNVVKWRRKVKSLFNERQGHWEPIPERIEQEKHAMVIMPAAEFVELALGSEGENLESHFLKLQRYYQNHTFIYLIEGLTPWMRKNRNVRNRQFVSAVRNAGPETDLTADAAPPPSAQRRQRDPKPPTVYIDEDMVEDALLQLQVLHGALIHHTSTAVETAQWVAIFTQHISTIPYRRQKDAANASAAFCMDSGQVRTGDGPKDTYIRMMQEIVRLTPSIAYGIASEFPTVGELVKGLEREGPLVLEGIRKSANKDGAFTDQTVGQAMSRRVYKVFTGRDEGSTDI